MAGRSPERSHIEACTFFVSVGALTILVFSLGDCSWEKINSTKAVSRFHSPAVATTMGEYDAWTERQSARAAEAWSELLKEVSSEYGTLRLVVQKLSVLDCLASLASVARQPGWCAPDIADKPKLQIKVYLLRTYYHA